MKLYIAKVNGKLLKAAREDWTWEEAQKHLKQTYGEDAVIEFVSSMPEENFIQSTVDLVVNHPEFEEFMRGKTCAILENGQRGVYSWDFEQYLKTVLK